jgi:hypothetical protein
VWAFAGFNLLYTLSAGWHYLLDMVVAAPFYVAVDAGMRGRWKSAAFVGNAAAVAGWLVLIRFGTHVLLLTPVVPWLLTAGTLALAGLTSRRAAAERQAAARA